MIFDEKILSWIGFGVIALVCVVAVIVEIVKFAKMSPDEKKKTLVTYLQGLVSLAEQEIGAGHGGEKLAMVEEYFNKKAPSLYKKILNYLGKDKLQDLIELALENVKKAFMK